MREFSARVSSFSCGIKSPDKTVQAHQAVMTTQIYQPEATLLSLPINALDRQQRID
jgi:hypothetical protein